MNDTPAHRHFLNWHVAAAAIILTGILFAAGCAPSMLTPEERRAANMAVEREFMEKYGDSYHGSPIAFSHPGRDTNYAFVARPGQNRIEMIDMDNGETMKTIGTAGDGELEFSDPADLWAAENLLFVAERGNGRVQVLMIPECTFFGFIDGMNEPSQVTAYTIELGAYYLFVADRYDAAPRDDSYYVRKYTVAQALQSVNAHYQMTFGYADNFGYLRNVIEMQVAPGSRRLHVMEDVDGGIRTRNFTFDGVFEGTME